MVVKRDFLAILLDSLDDDALAALAARLGPHLAGDQGEGLLSTKEAADRLNLHERTVVRMAREGRIPGAVKVGRGWRFPPDLMAPLPLEQQASAAAGDSPPRRSRKPKTSVRAIQGNRS
jgi:excisionase family DNA binding protein